MNLRDVISSDRERPEDVAESLFPSGDNDSPEKEAIDEAFRVAARAVVSLVSPGDRREAAIVALMRSHLDALAGLPFIE